MVSNKRYCLWSLLICYFRQLLDRNVKLLDLQLEIHEILYRMDGNLFHSLRLDGSEDQCDISHKYSCNYHCNSFVEGHRIIASTISVQLWMYHKYGCQAACQHYGNCHWDVLWMLLPFKSRCGGIVHYLLYVLHKYTDIDSYSIHMSNIIIKYCMYVSSMILWSDKRRLKEMNSLVKHLVLS